MELSNQGSLVAGLVVTALLVGLHLLAPRFRELPGVPDTALGSFGGGLAVAYVFLHLLPELAEGNEGVAEALEDAVEVTPLLDLGIFVVALTGFWVFYVLERLAARGTTAHRVGEGSAASFGVHLAGFAVYNTLITYTMPLRFRTGIAFAVLFAFAMGLHFVLTDRTLAEHYGARFGRPARLVLAGALVLGWLLALAAAPTRTLVVSLVTAFLGGSILLNVFKEELPTDRRSSLAWFTVGLVLYGVLLALTTALAE